MYEGHRRPHANAATQAHAWRTPGGAPGRQRSRGDLRPLTAADAQRLHHDLASPPWLLARIKYLRMSIVGTQQASPRIRLWEQNGSGDPLPAAVRRRDRGRFNTSDVRERPSAGVLLGPSAQFGTRNPQLEEEFFKLIFKGGHDTPVPCVRPLRPPLPTGLPHSKPAAALTTRRTTQFGTTVPSAAASLRALLRRQGQAAKCGRPGEWEPRAHPTAGTGVQNRPAPQDDVYDGDRVSERGRNFSA
jgi:hypothetical protein